jgi:adenylate cyclase class IV
MARNIEIKARIDDLAAVANVVGPLADEGPIEIAQDDTFFRCDKGRLKLRAFADGSGELIFYRRADAVGPKTSFYTITPTAMPDSLRETLSLALGLAGRVAKQRTLYLVGRTRVHLDRVEGLGSFVELEVVLREGEDTQLGVTEAQALMRRIGIDAGRLVEGAYVDLLRLAGPGAAPHA